MNGKNNPQAGKAPGNGRSAVSAGRRLENEDDLARIYLPGALAPGQAIAENPDDIFELTAKGHTVAVVSNGSAVAGLGDIGPKAALPLLEGKCLLLKRLARLNAFPLTVDSRSPDEIVRALSLMTASFGAIDLEAMAGPECFEIEGRLQEACDIPVLLSGRHGLAVVVAAGLENALKLAGKSLAEVKIVVAGTGASGQAVIRLLLTLGAGRIVAADRHGAVYRGRRGMTDWAMDQLTRLTNPDNESGPLGEILRGADVFIGLAAPNLISGEMVASMNKGAVVLALAGPAPEITPAEALAASSLSGFPGRIRHDLASPGLLRGALDARAAMLNDQMKVAAAQALAGLVPVEELKPDHILPSIFNRRTVPAVARAVVRAARIPGPEKKR